MTTRPAGEGAGSSSTTGRLRCPMRHLGQQHGFGRRRHFQLDTLTLTDCTLSGNTAGYSGGGIYNPGCVDQRLLRSRTTRPPSAGGIDNDFGDDDGRRLHRHRRQPCPRRLRADVYNLGVLNLDGSSSDGILNGHPAIPI